MKRKVGGSRAVSSNDLLRRSIGSIVITVQSSHFDDGADPDAFDLPVSILRLNFVDRERKDGSIHSLALAVANSSQSALANGMYRLPFSTYNRSLPTLVGSTPSSLGCTFSCFSPIEFSAPEDTIRRNRGIAKAGRSFCACLQRS